MQKRTSHLRQEHFLQHRATCGPRKERQTQRSKQVTMKNATCGKKNKQYKATCGSRGRGKLSKHYAGKEDNTPPAAETLAGQRHLRQKRLQDNATCGTDENRQPRSGGSRRRSSSSELTSLFSKENTRGCAGLRPAVSSAPLGEGADAKEWEPQSDGDAKRWGPHTHTPSQRHCRIRSSHCNKAADCTNKTKYTKVDKASAIRPPT